MKKSLTFILLITLLAGVFVGCGPEQVDVQAEYAAILEQPASEDTISEAISFLDKRIAKLDKESASMMIHGLEHYILGYDSEGIVYSEWIEKYQDYLEPDLLEFYHLMVMEQENPVEEDAALKLSWEELLQRTLGWEQFIRANKESAKLKDDMTWYYGSHINTLVMGTNGTPVFDYQTHEFSGEAREAYAAFINAHKDSVTAWALLEYFTYLESINYTMDYNDKAASKSFFDTCDWLVAEAGERVFQ